MIREYTKGLGVGKIGTRTSKKTWCPDCLAIVQDTHVHGEDDDEDSHGKKEAVNTFGMDPNEHAYATEAPMGPGPGRDYNPYAGWEPSEHDEHLREQVGQDDESGYNWGPSPFHDPGSEPGPHPDFHGDHPHPFGTPVHAPRTSPYDNVTGSRLGFNQRQASGVLMPGSRIGLPYNGQVIPGIVTHLQPDAQVGVRWHDGQYSVEKPGDVHLL